MSLMYFLTVIQAIVAALLVTVILMQKSEGGGLGTGGSPAGLMSARGAADFMTRLTAILATIFVVLSITLAALAARNGGGRTFDNSLDKAPASAPASLPGGALPGAVPGAVAPLGGQGVPGTVPAEAPAGNGAAPIGSPQKKG